MAARTITLLIMSLLHIVGLIKKTEAFPLLINLLFSSDTNAAKHAG